MIGYTNNKTVDRITAYLDEILPDARCELNYSCDYELLIAVILSAQTTDKKVNMVTPVLFAKYDLISLSNASLSDVEDILRPLGLYKNKAKNIILCAKQLVNNHNGTVPSDFNELVALNGVGIKTANVVRAELFNIPAIAVDTHVERVAKRLNLVKQDSTPLEVEKVLENIFSEEKHIKIHHQLIHFGRKVCDARKPLCQICKLKDICGYKFNK